MSNRLSAEPAPAPSIVDGCNGIPLHVGPYVYTLIVMASEMFDEEGQRLDGLAVEARRLLILDDDLSAERREEIAFHEYMHAWEFHVPRPRNAEERINLATLVKRRFDQDLNAAGGPSALLRIKPINIGRLGKPREEWLTPREVARQLAVSVAKLRRMIHAGDMKAMRIGRQYRIDRSDLAGFVEANSLTKGGAR